MKSTWVLANVIRFSHERFSSTVLADFSAFVPLRYVGKPVNKERKKAHSKLSEFGVGVLQLDLFDERNLITFMYQDFPGERLIACRNPDLARLRG
jgi:hypothetical protein